MEKGKFILSVNKVNHLFNHDVKHNKPIGKVINTELRPLGMAFEMQFEKELSNDEIKTYINFYKSEGMFISYNENLRVLKYKIGQYD